MLAELCAAARRIKARVREGEIDLYTDYCGEGDTYHIVGLYAPEYCYYDRWVSLQKV